MIASGTKNGFVGRENCFVRGGRWREEGAAAAETWWFFRRKRSIPALACATGRNEIGAVPMPSNLSLLELDDRIAVLRDNIRQLVEQAAGASGGQNEERTADRIAQQTAELDKLVLEREALGRK
jgi:hypothetical protein